MNSALKTFEVNFKAMPNNLWFIVWAARGWTPKEHG
jgi:hypothetical protein